MYLLPFWPFYLICSISGFFIAHTYLRYINPVYEVKAKVLIKDENRGISDQLSKSYSGIDLFGVKKNVDNELEVIISRPIISDAIIRSNSLVKIYNKGRVRDVYLGNDIQFKLIPLNPSKVHSIKKAPLNFDIKSKKFFVNGVEYQLFDFNQIVINKDSFQVRCDLKGFETKSSDVFLLDVNNLESETSSSISNLSVSVSSKVTSIMVLSLKTLETSQGKSFLNAIVYAYNNAAIQDKQLIASYTIDFIDQRLSLISNQLDSVERNLESYKSQNDIVDLSEQSKVYLNSVAIQDHDLNKIGVQLSVLDEVDKYMNGSGNNPGIAPSLLGIEDPMLTGLLNQYYALELQLQKQFGISAPKDDAVATLVEQIEKVKRNIRETKTSLKQNLLRWKNIIA
jgi:uncharacterized protein involved in exopolysaccharide biosynthesis